MKWEPSQRRCSTKIEGSKKIGHEITYEIKKTNHKLSIYKKINRDHFILENERGVVGVPKNGDMLGEPVIFVYLPKGYYRYKKTKSRFSENIKFLTTWHSHITSL